MKWHESLQEESLDDSKLELCGSCQECMVDVDLDKDTDVASDIDTDVDVDVGTVTYTNSTIYIPKPKRKRKPREFTNYDELLVIGVDLNPSACMVVNTIN